MLIVALFTSHRCAPAAGGTGNAPSGAGRLLGEAGGGTGAARGRHAPARWAAAVRGVPARPRPARRVAPQRPPQRPPAPVHTRALRGTWRGQGRGEQLTSSRPAASHRRVRVARCSSYLCEAATPGDPRRGSPLRLGAETGDACALKAGSASALAPAPCRTQGQ